MAHTLEISIVDGKNRTSTTTVQLPIGFTLAQYSAYALALRNALLNVITGGFRGAELCVEVDLSGVLQVGKPLVASDVEEIGEFVYQAANGLRTQVNIPAYDEANTALGSDVIDDSLAAVIAFNGFMVNGFDPGTGNVEPCDIGGSSIAALLTQRERFRNSGPAN